MSRLGLRDKLRGVFSRQAKDEATGPTDDEQGAGEADTGMPVSVSEAADSSLREMEPASVEIHSGSAMSTASAPQPPTGTVGPQSGEGTASDTSQLLSLDEQEPRRLEAIPSLVAPPLLQATRSWPQATAKLPEYVDEEALSVNPGVLKSFGSDTDIPQLEAAFPPTALNSTDSQYPTNSFGSTTTDYDAMYPPGMHKGLDFSDFQNFSMGGYPGPFPGMPPMHCVPPQMWAPYGHVPLHMYGSYPGMGQGIDGGADSMQTAQELEQRAKELMEAAKKMKQTASRQARWSGSVASTGSQRGSVSSDQGHRQSALAHTQGMPAQPQDADRTTVMLRNLPNDYKRDMLLKLLDSEGFAGRYNFVYLPMDFKRMAGLGYAFVNMETPEDAQAAWKHFSGFQQWTLQSMKVCEVAWGEPLQGLEAHIERYRNSPVMHEEVPEEFKPVLFENGKRMTFPDPTKRIRPPRMKYRTPAEGKASADSTADAAVMAAAPTGSGGSPGDGDGGSGANKFVD